MILLGLIFLVKLGGRLLVRSLGVSCFVTGLGCVYWIAASFAVAAVMTHEGLHLGWG